MFYAMIIICGLTGGQAPPSVDCTVVASPTYYKDFNSCDESMREKGIPPILGRLEGGAFINLATCLPHAPSSVMDGDPT